MAAHTDNARAGSAFLRTAAGVTDVRWPGFGGMVSFRHPDAVRIAGATSIFTLAESLGGVESLIEVPQAMTHQSVEGSDAAVPADLVRLSCGIEAAQDLVADLERATVRSLGGQPPGREQHMTEKTCAGDGCTCTTAREDGYCSDYCATHESHAGHEAHPCQCGHAGCGADATAG
jgi:hypothetical protein